MGMNKGDWFLIGMAFGGLCFYALLRLYGG